jgi:hypothetical protein
MKRSKLLRLGKNDYIKGLIVAILTAVLTAIYQTLTTGYVVSYKEVATVSVISAIGYILKNLGTNESGEILKKQA